MPETDNLVCAHIAADHAVRQPRLKRLVNDAPLGGEIALASVHEFAEGQNLRHAAAACVQYPNDRVLARRWGHELDFPHALAAVAAVLLEYARAGRLEPAGKLSVEFACCTVQMGVGAPAEMFCAIEHL